ncbi:hypothetical protein PFISCL1PPCAC_15232, partial [Pristionchus fissidentatus]
MRSMSCIPILTTSGISLLFLIGWTSALYPRKRSIINRSSASVLVVTPTKTAKRTMKINRYITTDHMRER